MATIRFDGISEYIEYLEKINRSTDKIAKKALHAGAGTVADEVRVAVEALPTDERWGTPEHPANGIKKKQKEALAEHLGVAPFQSEGDTINALIGFSGYTKYKTRKYPNGQPAVLIARVAESGTSFTKKASFMTKAVKRAKLPAKAAMKETFEKELEKE